MKQSGGPQTVGDAIPANPGNILNLDYAPMPDEDKGQILSEWGERENLRDTYLINMFRRESQNDYLQHFHGIEKAYEIITTTKNKVIVFSPLECDTIGPFLATKNRDLKKKMRDFLIKSSRFLYVEIPNNEKILNAFMGGVKEDEDFTDLTFDIDHTTAMRNINTIRHSLKSSVVPNPYKPQNAKEQFYVDEAFSLAQKYFPGLDGIDKMLDYVLNVKIDTPEVMKGKEINGVYCDIDGTLIEYVPIGSDKEGTQAVRKDVLSLLQSYASQGKEITLWTGGDVDIKTEYLRSLGITRPVVKKEDYAGAKAEIVLDDTDKSAFILQSKIIPKTYIDTRFLSKH